MAVVIVRSLRAGALTPCGPILWWSSLRVSLRAGALTPCMMVRLVCLQGWTGAGLALCVVSASQRRGGEQCDLHPGARGSRTPPTVEARHKRPMGRPPGPGWKERARSSPEVGLSPTSCQVILPYLHLGGTQFYLFLHFHQQTSYTAPRLPFGVHRHGAGTL